MKHTFTTTLSAHRHGTGIAPFTRDEWFGLLNCREILRDFKPGDNVKVTVEKVKNGVESNK